jgi:EamA domain-containing membrane protein RarD
MMAIIFLKDRVLKLQGFGIITAICGIIATGF